jgi:hypothetical protein
MIFLNLRHDYRGIGLVALDNYLVVSAGNQLRPTRQFGANIKGARVSSLRRRNLE